MTWTSRSRRFGWTLLGLAALYALAGFLILPPIVRRQAETRLSAALGRRVSIERVRINPFTFDLAVEDLDIREAGETASFLGWSRVEVAFDPRSLFTREWWFRTVAVMEPHVHAVLRRDGTFNFSDILQRLAAARAPSAGGPAAASRPLRVRRFVLTGGRVEWEDLSRAAPFSTALGPVDFALTEFRTANGPDAPYRLAATTESGESFAWTGWVQVQPLRSGGEFKLEGVVLRKYAPYYAPWLDGEIARGRLAVSGRYRLEIGGSRPVLVLSDGAASLRDFAVRESGGGPPVVEISGLVVTGLAADAVARTATVQKIAVDGGRARLRRERNGSINLLALSRADAAETGPAAAAAGAPPPPSRGAGPAPAVAVGEIDVRDFDVEADDLAAPQAVHLELTGLEFNLKNASLAEGAKFPLHLAFATAAGSGGGAVRVDGTVGIRPLQADLNLQVSQWPLPPFSPYLASRVDARVTQGTVSVSGRATWGAHSGFAGKAEVDGLRTVDGVWQQDLVGWSRLALAGLDVSLTPRAGLKLAQIELDEPFLRIAVASDKTINLLAAIRTPGAPAAPAASVFGAGPDESEAAAGAASSSGAGPAAGPAAPPNAASSVPSVEIGRIVIKDGNFDFADRSVEPHVHVALEQVSGTIAGIASDRPARAAVDLAGSVDGFAPVRLTGGMDPLGPRPSVDLAVTMNAVDLQPFSPYSGKFAGYEIARGKLHSEIHARLDGRRVALDDRVTLSQFSFGAPTGSPDATGLPVRLGVALLKDVDGNIFVDLPVEGSLDDPDFRVGRVVLRVLTNLLTRAAVSPFSLLGSMFGGGGEELAYGDFAAGGSQLTPADREKLAKLERALVARPVLNLGIEGSFDRAADSYALRRAKLDQAIRRRIWEQKGGAVSGAPTPDTLAIAPEDRASAIKALFDDAFPPGTPLGTPVPAPPAPVPPPAPPQGTWSRWVDLVTLRTVREDRAAKRETARRAEDYRQARDRAVAAGLPLPEMETRLAETMKVSEDNLRSLAAARAARVLDYLARSGSIAADRLFLVSPERAGAGGAEGAPDPGKGPRVFLQLQ